MDYRQLIINWHSKASEEDYFSKFVFEYLAFIAHLKTVRYIPANPSKTFSDREAIQKLKQDATAQMAYLQKINQNPILSYAWQELKRELDTRPLGNVSRTPQRAVELQWWNCSHNTLREKTQQEKDAASGVFHSLNDWENMVEFWYAVRNNLFHGAKDPESERDQLAVRIAYLTLSPLMEIFIDSARFSGDR